MTGLNPLVSYVLGQNKIPEALNLIDGLFGMEKGTLILQVECDSCGQTPENECSEARRFCGHHCNCSWVHDVCHWCGEEFGEEGGPEDDKN